MELLSFSTFSGELSIINTMTDMYTVILSSHEYDV